jgi:putative RNA 2'-phosphotransferase
LYHGTSRGALDAIRREGLKSMSRQKVHLSVDKETAFIVGRRHDPQPVILTIRALESHQAGEKFYSPQERVFLADAVEPRWIDFLSE